MAPSTKQFIGLLAAFAPSAMASCAYGTHIHPRADAIVAPNYAYWGPTGPAAWHSIDPTANALCASGTNQSPINVAADSTSTVASSELSFTLGNWANGATFENLGSTVEVISAGGNLTTGGRDYTLAQFHFHLPSEHLDNGKSSAMEMHLVWQTAASQLAVTGLYIDVGNSAGTDAASRLVESVLSTVDQIPSLGNHITTQALDMSAISSLFGAGNFNSYAGSLTTPPCSEGVSWFVSNQKVTISTATFYKARDVIGFNARFAQNTPGQKNILA